MSLKYDYEIELFNNKNESVVGILTIEHFPLDPVDKRPNSSINPHGVEKDPEGAVTYVITVVLLYGLAIIFMIASHVFVKKKEERLENQIQLVNKYIAQAPGLRERGARESYRKLKHSIVPVVAKSGARDLISRRKSFAPLLADAGITIDNLSLGRRLSAHSDTDSDDDNVDSDDNARKNKLKPHGSVPTFLEVPRRLSDCPSRPRLPSISEEELQDSKQNGIVDTSFITRSNARSKNVIPATVTIEDETVRPQTFNGNGVVPYRYDYRIPSHFKHTSTHTSTSPSTFHRQVPIIVITEGSLEEIKPDAQQEVEGDEDLELVGMDNSARCMSIESLSPYPESSESWQDGSNTSEYNSYDQELSDKGETGDLYQMTWVSDNSLQSAYTYGLGAETDTPGNHSPFAGDLQQAEGEDTFFL